MPTKPSGRRADMEPIHSGHFMKSVHENSSSDEELEVDVCTTNDDDVMVRSPERRGKDEEREKPVTFYSFGPTRAKTIVIDDSLGQLKKAIHTAYDRMTTPKWKDFKGLRLDFKQRIRLNNVIWRAWFREFGYRCGRRQRRSTSTKTGNVNWSRLSIMSINYCRSGRALTGERGTRFCYYSLPEDDQHSKVEGNVLEGMYWKRRQTAVAAQYRKWRHFWAYRLMPSRPKWKRCGKHVHPNEVCPVEAHLLPQRSTTSLKRSTDAELWDDDEFTNVFTDRLFDSLAHPYMFPDPKEIAQAGNADIIQPGLLTLQPSLEEIMRCLDDDTNDLHAIYGKGDRPSTSYKGGPPHRAPEKAAKQPAAPVAHRVLSPNHAASLLINCSMQNTHHLHQLSPTSAFHRMPQQPLYTPLYAQPGVQYTSAPTRPPLNVAWQPHTTAYMPPQRPPYQQDVVFLAPLDCKPPAIVDKRLIVPLKKRTPSGNVRGRPPPPKARKVDEEASTSAYRAAADSSDPSLPSDRKRLMHLQAEQSRREALKDGFIQIEELLPESAIDGTKQTNAVVLARAVHYIRGLVNRGEQQSAAIEAKKQRVQQLKETVTAYQTSIPVSGTTTSTLTAEQTALALYNRHVAVTAADHHKYYLLARVLRKAIDAAHANVTADEQRLAVVAWATEHCHVLKLRPGSLAPIVDRSALAATSALLVELVTACPRIIAEPAKLREYIDAQVAKM